METAAELLFGSSSSTKAPLFKNQLELVLYLLSTPDSAYFMPSSSPAEILSKAQSRLKTYISQLLSDNVVRVVTEDFKVSLNKVLQQKGEQDAAAVSKKIIDALEAKNATLSKQQLPQSNLSKRTIKDEIKHANYIAVITARPINMDTPSLDAGFSIRTYFFHDLIETLTSREVNIKYYRFNFPLETYGDQFWNGLTKIMIKFLRGNFHNLELINFLYREKFSLTTETLKSYQDLIEDKGRFVEGDGYLQEKQLAIKMATEIIERLARNRIITVFYVDQPIFSIPIIAINPDESTSKVYTLLENDANVNSIYQLTGENMLLWRIFVWDKMKAANLGTLVKYKIIY